MKTFTYALGAMLAVLTFVLIAGSAEAGNSDQVNLTLNTRTSTGCASSANTTGASGFGTQECPAGFTLTAGIVYQLVMGGRDTGSAGEVGISYASNGTAVIRNFRNAGATADFGGTVTKLWAVNGSERWKSAVEFTVPTTSAYTLIQKGAGGDPGYYYDWTTSASPDSAMTGFFHAPIGPTSGQKLAYIFVASVPAASATLDVTAVAVGAHEIRASWSAVTNATNYSMHVSTSSVFTPDAGNIKLNTTSTVAHVNGLFAGTQYYVVVRGYNASGGVVATSATVAVTTVSGFTFDGNRTRVIPNNVTINITRATAGSIDMLVNCAKIDAGGAVRSACTSELWLASHPTVHTFTYPQSLNVNTTIGDAGKYLLYVVDLNGTYLAGTTFCLATSFASANSTCAAATTVGSDLQTQLASDTVNEYSAALANVANARAVNTETTVRQYYLDFLAYAFKPFAPCTETTVPGASDLPGCKVSNLGWWYLGTLIVAAMGVARGRRIQ